MVQSANLGGAPGGAWHRAGDPSRQPSADHHRDLSRQLKRVVTDGNIGDPAQQTVVARPPSDPRKEQQNPFSQLTNRRRTSANCSTLQIGGMAGMDAESYGGFNNRVDNRYLKTFGSVIMGTAMEMAIPQNSTEANQTTASDAGRRNFPETFGSVADDQQEP